MDEWVIDWIAKLGTEQAKEYRNARGYYGHKVHNAVELFLENGSIGIHDTYPDDDNQKSFSELTPQEYRAVMTFRDWWRDFQYDEIDVVVGKFKNGKDRIEKQRVRVEIEVLDKEMAYYNEELGYATTLDLRVRRGKVLWLIDYKISKYVGKEHEMQLSGIANCDGLRGVPYRRAILQLGYEENKRGWKFNEVPDKWNLWLAAYEFWKDENADKKPKEFEYPLTLHLNEDGELTEELVRSLH
jgi:hypothetical protein